MTFQCDHMSHTCTYTHMHTSSQMTEKPVKLQNLRTNTSTHTICTFRNGTYHAHNKGTTQPCTQCSYPMAQLSSVPLFPLRCTILLNLMTLYRLGEVLCQRKCNLPQSMDAVYQPGEVLFMVDVFH